MSSSKERVNLGLPSGTQALPAGEQCGEIWGATVSVDADTPRHTDGRDFRVSRRFCGAGRGGDYRSGQCRLNVDCTRLGFFLLSPFCLPNTEKFLKQETHSPVLNASAFLQIQHHAKRGPPPCTLFSLLLAALFPSPFLRRHLRVMPFITHGGPKSCYGH
jgi:hypothetical protein